MLVIALVSGPASSRAPRPFERPLFDLQPNPPSAGQDVVVIYNGQNTNNVSYQVGDGESVPATIAQGRFTIPKSLLEPGKKLYLEDGLARGKNATLCVLIEP